MCRLSLFNKKGFQYIDSLYGGIAFMDYLEKECGGAGNGIALYKNEKLIFFRKGVTYSNKEIYQQLVNTDFDYCLYHTRIPSVGAKTDANCHPFKKGNTILAMNGTEPGFKGVAGMLGITDTEAVLRTAVAFTKDIVDVCTKQCDSTFIGFTDGKPFVVAHKEFWSGIQCVLEDDIIIFASTLPAKFITRVKPKTVPFVWREGAVFETEPVYQHQNTRSYSSTNYTDMFDRDGWRNIGGGGAVTVVKINDKESKISKDIAKDEKEEKKMVEMVKKELEKKKKEKETQKKIEQQAKSQRFLNGQWEDDPDYSKGVGETRFDIPYYLRYKF